MTRKLKLLGLALMAVCAMGAHGASAQAAEFWFETDGGFTEINGESTNHELGFDGGILKCKKTTFKGSIGGGPTGFYEPTPTYHECTFAGLAAAVDVNGCRYSFFVDNNTENGEYDVTTEILCAAGKEITVTVGPVGALKCTIHIPPQALGTGVVMTNGMFGGIKDLTADLNLAKIKYSQTAVAGGACATADNTNNGTYKGTITLKGFNALGEATNIWVA